MAFLRVSGEPAPVGLALDRFDLNGERVLIGRAAEANLRLPDSRVSRIHLVLERDQVGWLASDRGSANGTSVDGRPLSHPVRLRPGMVLELAGYRLRSEMDAREQRTETSREERRQVTLTSQERLALIWLCEPARRQRGEFTEPSSVREIYRAMHLAKSTVEKLLDSAQHKLIGSGVALDRARRASVARAVGAVTDEDLQVLPAPPRVTLAK